MSNSLTWGGVIANGVLEYHNRSVFEVAIFSQFKDGEVTVTVMQGSKRSNRQLRLIFGALYPPICDVTGYTKEELHEYIKREHYEERGIEPKRVEILGKVREFYTTAEFSHEEMGAFIERIKRIGTSLGCTMPDIDQ